MQWKDTTFKKWTRPTKKIGTNENEMFLISCLIPLGDGKIYK